MRKKILIIDDDKGIPSLLYRGLARSSLPKPGLLYSRDIGDSVCYIEKYNVDLVLLHRNDINKHVRDLVFSIYNTNRNLPFIWVTNLPASEAGGLLRILRQAFFIGDQPQYHRILAELVETCLDEKTSGFLQNIPMETFLQMLSMENKNCRIKLNGGQEGTGIMFLSRGQIIQALSNRFSGRNAAIEMVSWRNAGIILFEGCQAIKNDVGDSTHFIVMEACRLRDEKKEANPSGALRTTADPAERHVPPRMPGIKPPDRQPISRPVSEDFHNISRPVINALHQAIARAEGVRRFVLVMDDGTVLSEHQSSALTLGPESDIKKILADIKIQGASTKYNRLRSLVIPRGKDSDLMIFSLHSLNLVMEVALGSSINSYIEQLKPLIKRAALRLRG